MGNLDLGVVVEGVVELDPISGRLIIRSEDEHGQFQEVDVQARMEQYQGEEVRFIMTPLRTVSEIAQMVEAGEMDPSEIPVVKPS